MKKVTRPLFLSLVILAGGTSVLFFPIPAEASAMGALIEMFLKIARSSDDIIKKGTSESIDDAARQTANKEASKNKDNYEEFYIATQALRGVFRKNNKCPGDQWVIANSLNMNLYSQPKTNSKIIGKLVPGEKVCALRKESLYDAHGSWVKTFYGWAIIMKIYR